MVWFCFDCGLALPQCKCAYKRVTTFFFLLHLFRLIPYNRFRSNIRTYEMMKERHFDLVSMRCVCSILHLFATWKENCTQQNDWKVSICFVYIVQCTYEPQNLASKHAFFFYFKAGHVFFFSFTVEYFFLLLVMETNDCESNKCNSKKIKDTKSYNIGEKKTMATNFWSLRACFILRMRLAFFVLGTKKWIVEIWVQIKYNSIHEPEKWY